MSLAGYPNGSNPKHVRTLMHNVYERYAQGLDVFPTHRLTVDPAQLPRKSRAIASTLAQAWEGIDSDREYFWGATNQMAEGLSAVVNEDGSPRSGVVVTTIGQNALGFTLLRPGGPGIERVAWAGEYGGEEREELLKILEDTGIRIAGENGTIRYKDGSLDLSSTVLADVVPAPEALDASKAPLVGDPLLIIRGGGVASEAA